MREKLNKTIVPNICIGFTIAILVLAIGNILKGVVCHILQGGGIEVNVFSLFVCELFVLLCLITATCIILEKRRFKKKISYPLFELMINYLFLLGGAYVFRWMKFTSDNITEIAVIIIIITVVYLNLYFYNQKKRKIEANEINRLLKIREKELQKEQHE